MQLGDVYTYNIWYASHAAGHCNPDLPDRHRKDFIQPKPQAHIIVSPKMHFHLFICLLLVNTYVDISAIIASNNSTMITGNTFE